MYMCMYMYVHMYVYLYMYTYLYMCTRIYKFLSVYHDDFLAGGAVPRTAEEAAKSTTTRTAEVVVALRRWRNFPSGPRSC